MRDAFTVDWAVLIKHHVYGLTPTELLTLVRQLHPGYGALPGPMYLAASAELKLRRVWAE